MKTILTTLFFTMLSFGGFAQSSAYHATMREQITALFAARTSQDLQPTVNQLERIAQAEPREWHPAYYAAYGYVMLSFREKDGDTRDRYLDQAQVLLDRALKLQPRESELHVLQGYLHQGRLQVSPVVRGMKYSGLAEEALQKAKKLNPHNPRAYFLLGQNKYHAPRMFGGGAAAALPLLTVAQEKFAAAKPTDPLALAWGAQANASMLAKCREQ
ncbi:hypothetical protein BH24BAC1_BH24BAC1_35780 [soil metagenome]